MAKLTPKQELFVKEYLIDMNATQAYLRAGYKVSESVAAVNANRMLRNANVKDAIDKAIEKRSDKIGIDAEWVLNRLKNISDSAYAAADYNPANKATELIGKHIGMFKDKIEHSGNMDNTLTVVFDSGMDDE